MNSRHVKLAIIGCGAITERGHLPAIQQAEQVKAVMLIDQNVSRAQHLASQYRIECVEKDYQAIIGKADAAILALPHYLHAPIATNLLKSGVHVLVEKPMALTVDECDQMIAASKQGDSILAVGLVRRFYPVSKLVKDSIDNGLLGDILSFDIREGNIYNWPVTSDALFRKDQAGGGVLVDTGAHTLDMLLWWLGGFDTVEYFDDALEGGIEANSELNLELKNGARGTIELSRMRQLRNTYQIHGSKMSIEVDIGGRTAMTLRRSNKSESWQCRLMTSSLKPYSLHQALCEQLRNFIEAILHNTLPFVSGMEGREAVALIQTCYSGRHEMYLPWMQKPDAGPDSTQEVAL